MTYSFDQQQPPTPTRTPTSPSFGDVFKTPKFESSFYDPRVTWNTADPTATSPTFSKTPRPLSFETPNSRNVAATSPAFLGQNLEGEFFANAQNILATPELSSLQVDHQQLDTGVVSHPSSQGDKVTLSQSGPPVEDSSSFRSASNMQTPPPTTTSASKRQGKKVQIHQAERPRNASEAKRNPAPLLPKPSYSTNTSPETQSSQSQFVNLGFSPGVFGPDFVPPTGSKNIEQSMLWEPGSVENMSLDFGSLPNQFELQRQGGLDPFVSNHPSVSNSQSTMTDSFLDFDNDDTPLASFVQGYLGPETSNPGGMPSTAKSLHGVDPSLLFSSPGKISDTIKGSLPPGRSFNEESLQPYAYQVQEARREKAYSGISKPKRRRKPSVDSPAVKAALETLREDGDRRPAVRRSMTDSAVSRYGHESGSSRTSSAHGRSSPLKAIRGSRKPKQKMKHRTSIALTIDENGRARAETRLVNDVGEQVSEDAMEVDSASVTSDTESDSSSGHSDDEMVTSFASHLPGPKLGRFTNSNSHSQKSSYTSFYSTASYQDNQPSLPEMKQRSASSSMANSRSNGLNGMKARQKGSKIPEDPESEAETVLDSDVDDDNAQSQLRKVMKVHRTGSAPQPKHHLYSPLGISSAVFGNDHKVSSISPTTITDPDLPTPSSGRSSQLETIRCLCHSNIDEGQMIQWCVDQ